MNFLQIAASIVSQEKYKIFEYKMLTLNLCKDLWRNKESYFLLEIY